MQSFLWYNLLLTKNHINKVHKTKKFSTLKVLGFAPFRVMPKFKTFLTFFIFLYNFKNASKKITEAHFFVNLGFLICCFLQNLSLDRINGKYLLACPHPPPFIIAWQRIPLNLNVPEFFVSKHFLFCCLGAN